MPAVSWIPRPGDEHAARELSIAVGRSATLDDVTSSPHLQALSLQHRSPPAPLDAVANLVRRQTVVAIPSTYGEQNTSTQPGTVAGIVLGSVAGTVFIIWLIYLALNAGSGREDVIEEEVVVRSRRGSRSSRRAETIEVSRSSSSSSRSRSRPRRSPMRETRTERIIVEERRAPPVRERDDDIVEVIEERDPPRRKRSNRTRPDSGFRTVDPDRFAGGTYPVREVRRSGRR